ncbi:LytTR family DNA-binding domain-containing protein [Enterococcus faecalis]|uniref:LytTR family DNA-binding domain-containing protein n=1 Tax=Enterococcus faecalis TaxID=1351 RepID=UPI0024574A61|nr:LytTR family DNA-binding domain-containing protein [Enterococcus faecalis]MDH5041289.1 LytTR family DNA-binding domain-containing protein [Enterococcus faecalis]
MHECIRVANQRFKQINLFRGTVQLIEKQQIRTVDLSEILYLESSDTPHKIVIHRATEYFEIYGTLRDFEKEFEILCRCHQSFLVNLNHIKQVSIKDRLVRMSNEDICLVSVRGMKQLKLKLIERNIKYK